MSYELVWWLLGGLVVVGAARLGWKVFIGWYDRQWFDSEGDGRYE